MRRLLRNQAVRKKIRTRIGAGLIAFLVICSTIGSNFLSLKTYAAEEGLFEEAPPAEEPPAQEDPPAEEPPAEAPPAEEPPAQAPAEAAPAETPAEQAPVNVRFEYRASEGGTVTLPAEDINPAAVAVQGSLAVAQEGYTFAYWADENGVAVFYQAHFIPAFEGSPRIFTAFFNKVETPAPAQEETPAQPEGETPADNGQEETAVTEEEKTEETKESAEETAETKEASEEEEAEEEKEEAKEEEAEEEEETEEEAAEEETKYPAATWTGETGDVRVYASVGEGVFPEGTSMQLAAVSASSAIAAAQETAEEGKTVVDAVAVDITFHYEGAEIQPEGPVSVRISAKRSVEGESHEAVTIDGSGSASVVGGASDRTGAFETNHFTVYAIVGESYEDEVAAHARYTYEFYVDGVLIDTQIVKDGETLTVPADPAGDGKKVFAGWFTGDEAGERAQEVTAGPVTIPAKDAEGNPTQDQTIAVHAAFDDGYEVIFYTDPVKSAILTTVTGAAPDTVSTAGIEPAQKDDFVFIGWKKDGAEDTDIVGSAGADDADEEGNVHLVPVYGEEVTVYFDSLGGSDVEPEIAGKGELMDPPANPVREGYSFDGWYEDYTPETEGSEAVYGGQWFASGAQEVNGTATLYAKWKAEKATYTVQVRKEHANDDGYDVVETKELTGDVDGVIPMQDIISSYAGRSYEGFHLNGTGAKQSDAKFKDNGASIEILDGSGNIVGAYDVMSGWVSGSEDTARIAADGSTTVRVNYSRHTYTLYFRLDINISTKDNGNFAGTPYGLNLANGVSPAYDAEGNAVTSIAGQTTVIKYGENMYQRAYLQNPAVQAFMGTPGFKFNAYWRDIGGQTVFDSTNQGLNFYPKSGIEDGGGAVCVITLAQNQKPYTFRSVFYEQDGQTVAFETINTIGYDIYHAHTFQTGAVIAGIDSSGTNRGKYRLVNVTGYREVADGGDPQANGSHKYRFVIGPDGNPEELVLHYVPVAYSVRFYHNDGTGAKTDGVVGGSTDIYPGADISAICASSLPDYVVNEKTCVREGRLYVFQGWYDNAACAGDPFNFAGAVMPLENLSFYAKWAPANVAVTFHPMNGAEGNEDINTETKALTPSGKAPWRGAPAAAGVRQGQTFLYWAKDSEDGERFNFNEKLTADTHLYAVWAEPEVPYTVRYETDARGRLPAGLTDMTTDADGNSYGTDPRSYDAGAYAAVFGQAIPETGYIFTGWQIKDSADVTVTSGTFRISDGNPAAESHEITLVAQYAPVEKKTTFVTFHSNYPAGPADTSVKKGVELTGDVEKGTLTVNGDYVIDDDAQSLGFAPEQPANGTYTFIGWSTDPAGGNVFATEEEAMAAAELYVRGETAVAGMEENHLYAVWKLEVIEAPRSNPPGPDPGPGSDPTPAPADPETPPVGGGDESDVPEMPVAAILEEEEEEEEE
ncbi:MAG: InlB B-repeat-containing protein, partial [Lachnospiraceae bacterium]|nr:InlB B-repeat-containing protein [Lachnospiraceae bacterium]